MAANVSNSSFANVTFTIPNLQILINIWRGFSAFYILLGTALNLWFLVAILTVAEMRCRIRNKMLCSLFFLHLTQTVIRSPLLVYSTTNWMNCHIFSIVFSLDLLGDFVGDWILIELLIIFIAQLVDYDPTATFTPLAINIGSAALLALPWITSLITTPAVIKGTETVKGQGTCFSPDKEDILIFRSVDTAIPMVISVILFVVALVLRRRRFTRGMSSDAMGTELISRGPEIDSVKAYAVALGVATFCNILNTQYLFNFNFTDRLSRFYFMFSSYFLVDAKVIIMVLPWLFFPDIRERIKTWRPWYRPAPGIDLVVTYGKDRT